MRHQYSSTVFLFGLPFLLMPIMVVIFTFLTRWLGAQTGYLFGFAFYWMVWCLLVPRAILGKAEFATILSDRASLFSSQNWPAALLWMSVAAGTIAMYGQSFIQAPLMLIWLAIPFAIINGFCEEILWRGLYTRAFPNNPWKGIVYPAVGFGFWHFAPQSIYPAENQLGFALSTLFLGLAYGFITYRTGSAKWTAISHSLSGILALSGFLAPSLLALIGGT